MTRETPSPCCSDATTASSCSGAPGTLFHCPTFLSGGTLSQKFPFCFLFVKPPGAPPGFPAGAAAPRGAPPAGAAGQSPPPSGHPKRLLLFQTQSIVYHKFYTNTNFALLFSVLPRHFSKSFPAPLPDGRKKGACARQGLCAKPAQGGYLCSPCSSTEMTRWVGSCVSVRR